ncbi:MAG: peroxiredoxin [Alphaproteobacteria bacterium]|nr:peroxiredoxin [Alphaproteobacteria bacterium]
MTETLQAGGKAPAFDLPAAGGGRVTLAGLKGKTVVVYFYPKDDTSGCTKEAIGFTGAKRDFERAGTVVVGVSKDSVASHDKFTAKHKLDLRLGADTDGRACESYGVWIEKSMYGRKYMGIERATFLIDGRGVIREVWRKVKVPGHVAAVLAAARALAAP